MANETTTTSANDIVNDSVVTPTVILALSERPGLAVRVCREFNWTGPGAAMKIPKLNSFWGSPGDRGAGADTEFDGVEAEAAGNTQITTDGIALSAPEYVVAHALSRTLEEDTSLDGAQLLALIQGAMLTALLIALDDDFCALAPGLSQSVGSTGVDFTIAQAMDATHGIITRGANCDAMEFVLDPEQVKNVRTAALSTNASVAVYAATADRMIGLAPVRGAERGQGRVLTLDGCVVTQSGLCDTANTGADVAGMAFCPTTAYNDANSSTTFGIGWKRLPMLEQQGQAKARSKDIVLSMRVGLSELQDGSGTAVLTDAP